MRFVLPTADALNFGERKAITEEDVQHWKKRRLRGAKSVESLVSMPSSLRSSGTYGSKNLEGSMVVNLYTGTELPVIVLQVLSLFNIILWVGLTFG